jgi:hypothetical protein
MARKKNKTHKTKKKRKKGHPGKKTMPHCNDWIPLGLLLGLLPLLGFWQHRDNKNHEERKSEEKENAQPAPIRPARFYRQNPYFVVDIPLENAGTTQQRVTHVMVGSRSAASNANLFAVDSFPLDGAGRELRGLPVRDPANPTGPLIPGAVHSWAQRLSGPNRLRVWRLIETTIPPEASLARDRAAFNSLNFQLLNIRGTNSRVLNRVQIPVHTPPLYGDMIHYERIPIEPPDEFEDLGWDTLFDFSPLLQNDSTTHTLSFTPPESYLANRELTYLAYRFPANPGQTPVPGPPRPVNLTFPGTRVQMVFTDTGTDGDLDMFLVEMFRQDGTRSIKVGELQHNFCLENPDDPECTDWLCSMAPHLCGGLQQARQMNNRQMNNRQMNNNRRW